jgi:hypothetical protein
MATQSFDTFFSLPPGALSRAEVRDLFHRVFEQYRWFRPMRYGFANPHEPFDPDDSTYGALLDYYEEHQSITVAARTDRDFLLLAPATADAPPYTGRLLWVTSAKESTKASWRAAHLRQVAELMGLLRAPLVQACLAEDWERKKWRFIPCADGFGQERVFTVRDASEGLAGLFWRNVFGPPFVHLFGERLASLPPDTRQDLGEGLVLVQPYALPTQAGTPEGEAREHELITHLGPECFYDHTRHLKPSRLPQLAPAARQ